MRDIDKPISRGGFLKLAACSLVAIVLPPHEKWPFITPSAEKEEIDPTVYATKLPMLEYHDPEFNAVDACMTPQVFKAQLDWLEGRYYTPTAEEVLKFLEGKIKLPFNSAALRFDIGTDKIDPETRRSTWISVFEELEKRKLHGLVFVIPGTIEKLPNGLKWQDIAQYAKKGVISVCSHGLEDHPDYKYISRRYALRSMTESRNKIQDSLAKNGLNDYQVLGFAFPFDSIPDNAQQLIEESGYEFFAGGTQKNGKNAADFGEPNSGIPSIYPYVYNEFIENSNGSNLALLPVKGGRSFIDTLILNQNDILSTDNWKKHLVKLGKEKMLPDVVFTGRLIPPLAIIVHTDGQKGDVNRWNAEKTFNGVNGKKRKIAVNFGVDNEQVLQYAPMFRINDRIFIPEPKYDNDPSKGSQAAWGISASINIEMAGREFDKILREGSLEEKEIVLKTINNTAYLIANIIQSSQGTLGIKDVFGHYEMTIRGKSDPGRETMRILREKVRNILSHKRSPFLRPSL